MARFLAVCAQLGVCLVFFNATLARELMFEDRVKAQEAIERVYWAHRSWPEQNPGPKPEFGTFMSGDAIRAKVEDYLAKSKALESIWGRPLSSEQLQAEMDRMVTRSRAAGVLQEIFTALHDDPLMIAETLARQRLADRLIRSWYSHDDRFHHAVRAGAEAAAAACRTADCMRTMGGQYLEGSSRLHSTDGPAQDDSLETTTMNEGEWTDLLERWSRRVGGSSERLAVGHLSRLEETDDAFSVGIVHAQSKRELRTASIVWPKTPFDTWWSATRNAYTMRAIEARPAVDGVDAAEGPDDRTGGRSFSYLAPVLTMCTNDSWTALPFSGPMERYGHSAVWTGSEMIVWGGVDQYYGNSYLFTGGRYDPATDTWLPTSTVGLYSYDTHGYGTAIWTGTEMIVWGGDPTSHQPGGRYNPTTDTWTRISPGANVPDGATGHTAVWTGSRMIVWGGFRFGVQVNSGGLYDPVSNTWSLTSTGTDVPIPRAGHTAIWTGSRMIVWGGYRNDVPEALSSGGIYDPSTNTWTKTSTGADVPEPRTQHSAVWTGSEMIVWGGYGNDSILATGGRYRPATDTWSAIATVGAPSPRHDHTAVWTGSQMIVWGSAADSSGGRYDPASDSWLATSEGPNVPQPRAWHTAVWTGTEIIVWGGMSPYCNCATKDGGRYNPATDSWVPTSTGGDTPTARENHVALWTGAEMLVWGGTDSFPNHPGGRYDPATDDWTPVAQGPGAPVVRTKPGAVWTGKEMIVWGGAAVSLYNDGGRYDPATDTWTYLPGGNGAPAARGAPTAVWTGSEMIVWGGIGSNNVPRNDGGRYNPSTGTWSATSLQGAPSSRYSHSAVWSGTDMIVWGGQLFDINNTRFNTGGRYRPANDTWSATSLVNAPSVRSEHTAVWTGSRMIVWGGLGSNYQEKSGGSYDPVTDSWSATSIGANVPRERQSHSAIWSGRDMIVWGGYGMGSYLNDGGRYNPSSNTWTSTSTGVNIPVPRQWHTAVWTGQEMIVWGGFGGELYLRQDTGGMYCACPAGRLVYRDRDGDGFGNPGESSPSCDGAIPPGYVANRDDCNDAAASIHPGGAEVCNQLDDDCDGTIDDGFAPPTFVPVLSETRQVAAAILTWTLSGDATGYDIVKGNLQSLHASGGDFTLATMVCLGNDTTSASLQDVEMPSPGNGWWHLVRAESTCGGHGSFDEGATSQQGSRDKEIQASLLACP